MKLTLYIFALVFNINMYGQTDSITIASSNNIIEWQTKGHVLDSIFKTNYKTGTEGFLKDIYSNLKITNHYNDNWFANYLVNIKITNDIITINFKNSSIKSDKNAIERAILATKEYWNANTEVELNLVFSKYESNQIKEFEKAFVQLGIHAMDHKFPCNSKDCFQKSKIEMVELVQNCIEEEEFVSALHYLKRLARVYPFDKEVDSKIKYVVNKQKVAVTNNR